MRCFKCAKSIRAVMSRSHLVSSLFVLNSLECQAAPGMIEYPSMFRKKHS
jgi:hypothetical protein